MAGTQMLETIQVFIDHLDNMIEALEKYELIPGITGNDIRKYKQLREELLEEVTTHVDQAQTGLICVIGKLVETGLWKILAGPYDVTAYMNKDICDLENDPLVKQSKEFPYDEIVMMKNVPTVFDPNAEDGGDE